MLFWLLPDRAVYWWQDKIDGPRKSTIMPILLMAEVELVMWWSIGMLLFFLLVGCTTTQPGVADTLVCGQGHVYKNGKCNGR